MSRSACINKILGDDELRVVLSKLEHNKDKDEFGLVCKRWLRLQSNERRKLRARAGPHMLRQVAARFTSIHELDVSQSICRSYFPGVADSDLSLIADAFCALRVLNLQHCRDITDKGIMEIGSKLSSLQSLDVSYCRKLTDKGLSSVAEGCHNLRSLHLAGCRFITKVLLSALSTNCNYLEELNLQGCTNITDSGLTVLVEGCRTLKHLDIDRCSNIGDVGISSMSKSCSSSLLTLNLMNCYKIGDDSIFSLAKYCKNLETLIIGGCRKISNESLKSLAAACSSSLKNLRMDWCLNVSDTSVDCIFSFCRNLEVLDVGCCDGVTDVAFQGLGTDDCKLSLKILRISNCSKITVDGIGKLLKSCEGLQYLDVRSCPHITEMRCNEAGLQFPTGCKVNFNGSLAEPDFLR